MWIILTILFLFITNFTYADINVSGGIKYTNPTKDIISQLNEPPEPENPEKENEWHNPGTGEVKTWDGSNWVLKTTNELALKAKDIQTLSNDGTIVIDKSYLKIIGNGNVILDTNPAIEDGIIGKIIFIEGTSDSNIVTIFDNVNTQLEGGISMSLGKDDTIGFVFNGTDWIEFFRGDK